jgi:hypothetical protein
VLRASAPYLIELIEAIQARQPQQRTVTEQPVDIARLEEATASLPARL